MAIGVRPKHSNEVLEDFEDYFKDKVMLEKRSEWMTALMLVVNPFPRELAQLVLQYCEPPLPSGMTDADKPRLENYVRLRQLVVDSTPAVENKEVVRASFSGKERRTYLLELQSNREVICRVTEPVTAPHRSLFLFPTIILIDLLASQSMRTDRFFRELAALFTKINDVSASGPEARLFDVSHTVALEVIRDLMPIVFAIAPMKEGNNIIGEAARCPFEVLERLGLFLRVAKPAAAVRACFDAWQADAVKSRMTLCMGSSL